MSAPSAPAVDLTAMLSQACTLVCDWPFGGARQGMPRDFSAYHLGVELEARDIVHESSAGYDLIVGSFLIGGFGPII